MNKVTKVTEATKVTKVSDPNHPRRLSTKWARNLGNLANQKNGKLGNQKTMDNLRMVTDHSLHRLRAPEALATCDRGRPRGLRPLSAPTLLRRLLRAPLR